jgi:hypothetical protein
LAAGCRFDGGSVLRRGCCMLCTTAFMRTRHVLRDRCRRALLLSALPGVSTRVSLRVTPAAHPPLARRAS